MLISSLLAEDTVLTHKLEQFFHIVDALASTCAQFCTVSVIGGSIIMFKLPEPRVYFCPIELIAVAIMANGLQWP